MSGVNHCAIAKRFLRILSLTKDNHLKVEIKPMLRFALSYLLICILSLIASTCAAVADSTSSSASASEWFQTKRLPYLEPQYAGQYHVYVGLKDASTATTVSLHIFLDEWGHPLLYPVPQGLPGRNYIVHVIYWNDPKDQRTFRSALVKRKGGFNANLVIETGAATPSPLEITKGKEGVKMPKWAEIELALGGTNEDIEIDVIREAVTEKGNKPEVVRQFTIPMAKIYHGSIDGGFIVSTLRDPSFTAIALPAPDSGLYEVKENSATKSGFAVITFTPYLSPVAIVQRWINKDLPRYQLTSRCYLDDHYFYERFYPTIGVGIKELALKNLVAGVSWEPCRGVRLFGGQHFAKVHTFDTSGDFEFGETKLTKEEYDLRTDEKWLNDWSYGVTLDFLVLKKFFGL